MDDARFRNDQSETTRNRFAHYVITRRIASGGMGEVYEATDERLQRRVALKMLPPWSQFDEHAVERFRREARAASALNHPSICTIYEFDEFESRPYIAMELVEGPSLEESISAGATEAVRAAEIMADIARGLEHAHARSITHRDIKPANILLSQEGDAKIADFGLARIADASTITNPDSAVGTVAYMSPEQARGEDAGPKSDVWSLGVVYYELLTGRRPFRGEFASAVMYSIVHESPAGLDEIGRRFGSGVQQIITECLQKQADRRPDASTLARRLRGTIPPDAPAAASTWLGRTRIAIGVVGVTILAVAVALGLFLTDSSDLSSSSVAIFSPDHGRSGDQVLSAGFVSSVSSAVKEIAETRRLVRHVVPHVETVAENVRTSVDAGGKLGVPYAILLEFEDDSAIEIRLVETASGRTIEDASANFDQDNLERSFDETVRALLGVLGLPSDVAAKTAGHFLPAEPGAMAFYTRAVGLIGQGTGESVTAAVGLLDRAIERSPQFARAYAGLGDAHLILYELNTDPAHLESAKRYADRAIELRPTLIDAYITLARVNLNTGLYGQARLALNLALAQDSVSTEALLTMGEVLEAENRLDEAVASFRSAIRLQPDYWNAYRELGMFYYDQSDYQRAADQFEHVVELAPLNSTGYLNLGAAHYALGSSELAYEYWGRGLEFTEDYALVQNIATVAFYEGRYEEAASALRHAVELNSSDYRVWGNLGTALRWSGAGRSIYEEAKSRAVELAEEAIAVNPRDEQARAKLAGYHAEMGDTTAARTYLGYFGEPSESLRNETVFEVGAAWEAVGDRDMAVSWIAEALQRGYPTNELNYYPGLVDLRADPAFQEMLAGFEASDKQPG